MTVDSSPRQRAEAVLRQSWAARTQWRTASVWTGTPGVVLVALIGAFFRLWQLGSLGFNSDVAVYAGQAASVAGRPEFSP